MKTETAASFIATTCVACKSESTADAKFCNSCGHALYEPCGSCESLVLLTQKFCVSCGFDLVASLRAREANNDERLSGAIAAAKAYDFDQAVSLLEMVAKQKDHRFREAADSASKALTKVSAMKVSAENSAVTATAAAEQAAAANDHAEVVRVLSKIPGILLGDAARRLLSTSKRSLEQVGSLESDVRDAVAKRDWSMAGGLIAQLIDTDDRNQDYQTLGVRVSRKLVSEAEKLFLAQRYQRAVDKLGCIPPSCHSEADDSLRERILNAQWLSAQFDAEPFATPMLGRLAVRFAKEFPEDEGAQKLVKTLSATLKQSARPLRMHLPAWRASRQSWVGGEAGLLAVPTSIVAKDQPMMRSAAGRFTVAMGIGLQGLGKARFDEFYQSKKRKKGLLGGFSRKKKSGCWAVDIGSSSLKAVRMQWINEKPVVTDCFFQEFENPFCRVGQNHNIAKTLKPIIETLLAEKDFDDVPVYVNLPASLAITRFVRLPPVSDKQATELLRVEIGQRIPVPVEDLFIIDHISSLDEDSFHGRAAVMTAIKRSDVDNRFDLLDAIGLACDGLQADTIALANFAACEFADLWVPDDQNLDDTQAGDDVAEAKKKKLKKSKKKIQSLYDNNEEKTPAVAIIDCGAASTKIVIVSGETHWAWSIENGGEDLTTALARATKTTHAEAEKLKRNPAELPSPHSDYQLLEQRQIDVRSRLERMMQDAKNQNSRFQIQQSWCVGGGVFAHGWLRRTMLSQD